MTDVQCPVCQSVRHQSFWYWEKEDKLMQAWAQDTQAHFSICRDCSTIFQNPMTNQAVAEFNMFDDFNLNPTPLKPSEPLEWLRQFTGHGKTPGTALEVYATQKRFEPTLSAEGWTIKSVHIASVLSSDTPTEAGEETTFGFQAAPGILPDDQFDAIFFFDGFGATAQPIDVLNTLHAHLKEEGCLYIETSNPLVLPRHKRICLTSEEICVYPFQSLVFALYKSGFKNIAAEMCERNRIFCTKIEPSPEASPNDLIPNTYWGQVLYNFQRNYYWAWVTNYLEAFQVKHQSDPTTVDQVRDYLQQHPIEKLYIRDACGSCLLLVEEVGHLKDTLSQDWKLSMSRIFDLFKNDYAIYDLLQQGKLEGVGTFPDLERFHYNEKMIYMATPEYFERFFSEEEAESLCNAIMQAGRVVVGHLSSFL
jgi:hypothetical protein